MIRPSAKFTPNIVSSLRIVVETYFVHVANCESMIRSPRDVSPYRNLKTFASMNGFCLAVELDLGSGSVPLKRISE